MKVMERMTRIMKKMVELLQTTLTATYMMECMKTIPRATQTAWVAV